MLYKFCPGPSSNPIIAACLVHFIEYNADSKNVYF